jgi:parallel beta-helix repeat protein
VVPDNYLTIQEAINKANVGDTIYVRNGTYTGTIVVNKTVSLVGENRATTIIDAGGNFDGVLVEADNVTIMEFMVWNTRWFGIHVKSSGCYITTNNLTRNQEGIMLDGETSVARNNVVFNNSITDNLDTAILIWNSQNNNITQNFVRNNAFGIYLHINASMNLVEHNQVLDNECAGIPIAYDSSDNIISDNNVSGNGHSGCGVWESGISLAISSKRNIITRNEISNNRLGILLQSYSDTNLIYHNNLINNTEQVEAHSPLCSNIWNIEYPCGGNFWDNYNGTDLYSGPYQNITGSDGIGDSSHVINSENVDRYPLMEPFDLCIGDLSEDGKVDMVDLGIASRAFGSYPGHPRWNPIADLNKDERVDTRDIAVIARNFGKTHLD